MLSPNRVALEISGARMLVQCGQCNKTLKVPDAVAGKRIRCPACSGVVDVPLSSPMAQSSTGAGGAAAERRASTASEGERKAAAGQASENPPVRKARSLSSDTARSAEAASGTSGGARSASQASSRGEPTSRGNSGPRSNASESVRVSRETSSRSTSREKSRRPAKPVEDYDDDYEGFEDDHVDFYESNPFAPPKARSSGSQARSGGSDDVSSRRLAGLGLLIQGWATVSIFLLLLFVVIASFIAGMTAVGSGAPAQGLVVLIGLAAIAMFVAAIVVLVGECMCLAVPQRSGAKGLIISAICCLAAQVFFSVVQAMADNGAGNPFSRGPFPAGPSAGQLLFSILGMLSGLAHLVCFELFLKRASEYMRRDDLARQANAVLIGIPSCFGVIFVSSLLAPLLARNVMPLFGLIMLAPIIGGGIALVVFSVMHVSLLFRVGAALRS